ncbi:MAG TPA: protocatechuate 3,4-dioxygenase subunit alpha [Casimicrobiaceae bacterium]|nr:protocatechuate 3,4-dioxygenase subunit alpha [Casimicrobiaceae bacterium]
MSLLTTSSQTAGPYLRIGMARFAIEELAPPGVSGERITLTGRFTDGDGKPIDDAAVEIWQANAQGKYAHPEDGQDKPIDALFRGFGRSLTDAEGRYRFATIRPGRVPGPGGALQAPHIAVTVLSRGLLKHLFTRVYFADDPANAEDPVLRLVPVERRTTLIAARTGGAKGAFEWNIRLQGVDETVFFDV